MDLNETPASYTTCTNSQLEAILSTYDKITDESLNRHVFEATFTHSDYSKDVFFSMTVTDGNHYFDRRYAGKIGIKGKVTLWVYPDSLRQFIGKTFLNMHVVDL